jgi:transposase
MSELFLLSERQLARIAPHFPLSHGVKRVDDQRVISRIVCVIRNGLPWKDAPKPHGPHKTLYNRLVRWSLLGVFDRIFTALEPRPIFATYNASLDTAFTKLSAASRATA